MTKKADRGIESEVAQRERILTRAVARATGELARLKAEVYELRLRLKWSEGEVDIYRRLFRSHRDGA